MAKRKTKEEKVAETLVESVNDFTLDLEATGAYFAKISGNVLYNRMIIVMDSAEDNKHLINNYTREAHELALQKLSEDVRYNR